MKTCIYCQQQKNDKDERTGQGNFSLEHVIPIALGGAIADPKLKITHVCKQCNNDLGQFVDAAFVKDWFVSNAISRMKRDVYTPDIYKNKGLPLICMGESEKSFPYLQDGQVHETWLGPFGETVVWVRAKEERLYWYVGGNPRTMKKTPSQAYFFFTKETERFPPLTLNSFKQAFSKRKVKKILGTKITDENGNEPLISWFDTPDEIDSERIKYIFSEILGKRSQRVKQAMFLWSEVRFLCKLSIGILFSLFGDKVFQDKYFHELYTGLWDQKQQPKNQVLQNIEVEKRVKKNTAVRGAITIGLNVFDERIFISLNIGGDYLCGIPTISTDLLNENDFFRLAFDGVYIVICEALSIYKEMTGYQFDRHKQGMYRTKEIEQIELQVCRSAKFFSAIKLQQEQNAS